MGSRVKANALSIDSFADNDINTCSNQESPMDCVPISGPPPIAEMHARLERVLLGMATEKLDHFVLADPHNIYWLSHFANFVHERPFILVLSRNGALRFVVPELEIPHVNARVVGEVELVPYFEFPAPEGKTWADQFSKLFPTRGRVGVEATCPTFVRAAIPLDTVASEMMEELRYLKSDYEIGRICYASDIVAARMMRVFKMARPGMSSIKINSGVNRLASLQLLLDRPDMNPLATRVAGVVQPPSISHDPHNFTKVSDLNMERGGPNVLIVAGVMNGYGAEVERTFFLGHVPDAARRPYEVMMRARRLAFELCKPGALMHDVDAAVNELFRKAGFDANRLHRTGHGIGVTQHEGPFLAEGLHREIRPGMVFTIEPGIYLKGVGGFRHSDTVLVTETGNVNLTPVPDSLEELTFPARRFAIPPHARNPATRNAPVRQNEWTQCPQRSGKTPWRRDSSYTTFELMLFPRNSVQAS